jgi:nucleoside-diphosphate-sugar epimerase
MTARSDSTVLVLGANGRFGQAAVAAFAAAGWQVLAQMRRAPDAPLPAGARLLTTPLADADALAAQAAGARVLVHALNPPYTRWRAEVPALGAAGMALAQRLGARFMLPGNVYGFGAAMPALLRPDTPERPDTGKGRIRCALEAEMRRRADAGLRSVVIRAGDFYGGGRGAWFDRVIVGRLGRGRLVYPGPRDVAHAWAYLPDLARAFVAVAEAEAGLDACARLHFAGHTLTGTQLLDAVERAAAALGVAPPGGLRRGGLPWPLLRVGGWVVPMWREIAELAYLWRVPHALDGSALQALVGALPGTPVDAAVRQALRALGHGAARDASWPARPFPGA